MDVSSGIRGRPPPGRSHATGNDPLAEEREPLHRIRDLEQYRSFASDARDARADLAGST